MSEESRIDEHDLHAYVDGALAPERRAAVEALLRADPRAAERVEAYRRQNRLLRSGLDPMLEEPVPARLRTPRSRFDSHRALRYAGFAALLFVGVVVGWFLHGEAPGRADFGASLAQRAAVAHLVYAPEVLHPVEVDAGQEAHLVGWLSKRMGVPVRAPHLGGAGFHLVGGRLLPGEARPAAQFMYEDRQGRRLTLYVADNTDASRATAFRYAEAHGVSTFYWSEGRLGYALSGELQREQLLQVAEAVYRELNR